jgi:hypothetical protein
MLRSNSRRIILDINYSVLQGYDEKYNDIAKKDSGIIQSNIDWSTVNYTIYTVAVTE